MIKVKADKKYRGKSVKINIVPKAPKARKVKVKNIA